MTSIINDPSKGFITVSGFTSEEFLQTVIDYSKEGYTLVNGTAFLFGTSKAVDMYRPKVEEVPVEAEQTLEGDGAIDSPAFNIVPEDFYDQVVGFEDDKDKLQAYGLDIGIPLKKNKTFANMLIDLEDSLGIN